jgi:hypothetical protein
MWIQLWLIVITPILLIFHGLIRTAIFLYRIFIQSAKYLFFTLPVDFCTWAYFGFQYISMRLIDLLPSTVSCITFWLFFPPWYDAIGAHSIGARRQARFF